ncbi:MAG: hypothetical protein E7568_06950 [Ruminococcaceae bacterium]|nr:hypothetical protein [Oscillospiraceae bacterium]
MISVLPLKDKNEIKSLFLKHGIEFSENANCVMAKDKEEILGYCLFRIENDEITVFEIEPKNDLLLADGILRSALHNGVCANVAKAFYSQKAPEEIFEKLKFILNRAEKTLNISKLFESCSECQDKNT